MNRLIGLTGGMGVGKSTAIDLLNRHSEKRLLIVKFAQPLYEIQEYAYKRISSVIKRDASFIKDRKLLQWIGTEWGRDTISKTIWVDIWKAAADNFLQRGNAVICDDVRFDNEAEAIKSMGGVILEITSSLSNSRINTQTGIPKHATESGISRNLIDFSIENNDTLLSFENKLLSALNTTQENK